MRVDGGGVDVRQSLVQPDSSLGRRTVRYGHGDGPGIPNPFYSAFQEDDDGCLEEKKKGLSKFLDV